MRRIGVLILILGAVAFWCAGCGGEEDSCTPACEGKECGDDGCDGTCGSCPGAAPICSDAGQCVQDCTPTCAGKVCGGDGCGGSCGTCPGGSPICNDFGQCVSECVPDCSGRECGSDGCGGGCGSCPAAVPICTDAGQCIADCAPSCVGKECGDDGCGGGCGTCTNGICQGGVCGCNDAYDCDATSICYQSDCVMAYGRQYKVTFESALIDETAPDGSAWDTFGGAPDPFVSYKFDNVTGSTSTKDDTLQPAWNESVDVQLSQNQTISVTVYDEDTASHDEIGYVDLSQIPVSAIKDGGISFSGGDLLDFVWSIDPK